MRRTALLLASLVLLSPPAGAEPPSAGELLDRSIAYHDPEGRLLSRPHRLSFLETRPGGPDRRTEALIDVAGERFEIARRGEVEIAGVIGDGRCAMTLDGRSEVSDEERETHRLSCERLTLLRDYYTYLWGLPMKLRDPGTRLGEVTETSFADREVYGLRFVERRRDSRAPPRITALGSIAPKIATGLDVRFDGHIPHLLPRGP